MSPIPRPRPAMPTRRSATVLLAVVGLVSVPAVAVASDSQPVAYALGGATGAETADAVIPATAVSTIAQEPSVVEFDLAGVDPAAKAELDQSVGQGLDVKDAVDPELDPGLLTVDPLGVLADEAEPEVITERLTVDPFSVMGVTWELDPTLEDVVVQYRTFREGTWTEWGWTGQSEEIDPERDDATRAATDAIFVPDSTGVPVIVSATGGTPAAVKVVLIDPGAGPDGTGASVSSGAPTDPSTRGAEPGVGPSSPEPSTDQTPEPSTDQVPEPSTDPTTDDLATEPSSGETEPEEPASEASTTATFTQSAFLRSTTEATVSTTSLATAASVQPRIVTRAQWGAAAPVCAADTASSTVAAVVHHTASTNTYTAAQVPGLLRGFAAYHMRPEAQGGRGWCDIGYNFLVDKFGTIYEGRAGSLTTPMVGVHVGGFNSRTLGVSAIGNYQDAVPSAAMNEAISQIIAWNFSRYRILANTNVTMVSGGGASKYPIGTAVTFNTIFGHRDAQLTACPGQHLFAMLPTIRNRVAQLSNQVVNESPQGSWDVATGGANSVRVAGWAKDPDASGSVQVQVLIDGNVASTFAASQSRSDVGPHGYDARVAASPGSRTVCVRYINRAGGADVHKGCRQVTATNSNPVGSVDDVRATSNSIIVRGWARDPDSMEPIGVHIYVDGRATAAWTADGARPDVEASAPGQAGPRHGFDSTISALPGRHTVCVYGINVGSGSNSLIGCRDVTVVNKAPIGHLDAVRATGPDSVSVAGWALDPDTSASIGVHIYVDGRAVRALTASGSRSDIARIYGLGEAHGFSTTVTVRPGNHEVCVYGIDSEKGSNPRLGCKTVTVTNRQPVGALDVVRQTSPGTVQARGWAFDPDTANPIAVHVYVDGKVVRGTTANTSRPDVARVRNVGQNHGFDTSVALAAGNHQVCVYAIDSTGGPNPRFGCAAVTVS